MIDRGQDVSGPVGLVLSGGGARGAYEFGVLSALAPVLEERGERVEIIVGTSAGALNAAYLAAGAGGGLVSAVKAGCQLWADMQYGDVLGPLMSARAAGIVVRLGLGCLGFPVGGVPGLLDATPLAGTITKRISFDALAENVRSGVIQAAAVAATCYDTGRSVVFCDGPAVPPRDDRRAIDYVPARLAAVHVRASTAIQALFPAIQVDGPAGAGWHGDGGTSLNTPLKPALALGAGRLIVIGLTSTAGSSLPAATRPADVFDGAAQVIQSLYGDQLASDVATLATTNQILAGGQPEAQALRAGGRRAIPYIFVSPQERFAIGALASTIYRQHYARLRGLRRAGNLALLGRLLGAGRSPVRGELFSYMFFAPEFAEALISQGRHDAECWLARQHDDGPWRVGPLP